MPPGSIDKFIELLKRRDVLARLGACVAAMMLLLLLTQAWRPPQRYRSGGVPTRSVVASIDFSEIDSVETERLQDEARAQVVVIYNHDSQPLMEKLEQLKGEVFQILAAESFTKLNPDVKEAFFNRAPPDDPAMIDDYREDIFQNFRLAMEEDADLKQFEAALQRAFAPQITDGMLEKLQHTEEEGTLLQIRVRPKGNEKVAPRPIETDKVRIATILPQLEKRLKDEFKSEQVAEPVFYWLKSRLPTTLTVDPAATDDERQKAADAVPPVEIKYKKGETILAKGGAPLNVKSGDQQVESIEAFQRIQDEHTARVAAMGFAEAMSYVASRFGMYVAMVILGGFSSCCRQ